MSTLKLRLLIGLAVLAVPAAGWAQGPCPWCTVQWIDVPLKDNSGNVRVTMRVWQGEPGKRRIQFIDSQNNMVINAVAEPESAPVASENALRGDPIPNVLFDEPADAADDIQALRREIDHLKQQVNLLRERINAAAAR